jgi:cobalt transporter subunit CbtA
MIVRYLLAALAAGLLAGILMTPVQYRQVVPIILHAETFESGHEHGAAAQDHSHEDGTAHDAAHEPVVSAVAADADAPFLLGRFWNTVAANLVTGAGFALLMAGVSLLSGVSVRFSTGLAWGAAGWLAVQFLPGIGLPPELPGFPFVDLQARQVWWTATVAASVAGMTLLFLRPQTWARITGIALLLAPHLYGAPKPADIAAKVPAYLAAEYVMAALSTTLFFWLALGLILGLLMDRYGKAA